jgi:hypothetical protein
MNAQAVAVEGGVRAPDHVLLPRRLELRRPRRGSPRRPVGVPGGRPLPHFAMVAILAAIVFVVAYGSLLPSHADASDEGTPAFARPTRVLLGLGIICFCVLLGEGAMGDWSAVYLDDTLGTGPGFAAAGYAAFSLSMAFGRLFGDRLTELLGPTTLVRWCAAIAAVGLGAALAAAQPFIALAGFSIIFPTALSAAGRTGGPTGPALAAVTTAYTGFLVGPPVHRLPRRTNRPRLRPLPRRNPERRRSNPRRSRQHRTRQSNRVECPPRPKPDRRSPKG